MLRALARAVLSDEIQPLLERAIRAEVRLDEQAAVIADLSRRLLEANGAIGAVQAQAPSSISELIEAFKTHALVEQPFAEGKVPEELYLTPAYHELKKNAGS